MKRLTVLAALVLGSIAAACSDATAPPVPLRGVFILFEENGREIPADPFPPNGCCLTLSGALTFRDSTYEMLSRYRDKVTPLSFFNAETGKYVRSGNSIEFTRTGGDGLRLPYRITEATVSNDGQIVVVTYGEDAEIRATFRRCDACVVD